MLVKLCNDLCVKMGKKAHDWIGQAAGWLASKAGKRVVEADAVLLPKGFSMFDNELAKQVGVERAAMYQKVKGWQEYNCRKGKRSHFRRDRWWTYGKPEYWFENEFIWSSLSTVRRAFSDLEKAGLMVINRIDGEWWLSALVGEPVNLTAAPVNVQLGLFNVESEASNWRSSIGESSTLKQAKGKRQTNKRAGIRKDAVADFNFPEYRDQVGEIRESREVAVDGRDVLAQLPGALVTGWTDAKLPLEQLVAKYGADTINRKWDEAKNFKSQVAGLRTLLKATPAPYPPVPPPPPMDDTNPDYPTESDAEATPDIDVANEYPIFEPSQKDEREAWLKAHVAPALLANGGGSW